MINQTTKGPKASSVQFHYSCLLHLYPSFHTSHIAHFFSFTQSKEDDVSKLHFVQYRLCYVFLIIKIVMLCGIILAKTTFLSLHFHAIPLWSLIFFFHRFQSLSWKTRLVFVPAVTSKTENAHMANRVHNKNTKLKSKNHKPRK